VGIIKARVIKVTYLKQPGCKKGAALFKMASVKKLCNQRGQPRNGCDGIG